MGVYSENRFIAFVLRPSINSGQALRQAQGERTNVFVN